MRRTLLPLILALAACPAGDPPPSEPAPLTRLQVDRTYLRDDYGRYVFFHGVNVSGDTKVAEITMAGGKEQASFMNRPFPFDKADEEFEEIRQKGFNAIRLIVVWEAIQPEGPDTYDAAYLGWIRELTQAAGRHGLYVLLDMHQDIFSRHLYVKYTSKPQGGTPGTFSNSLFALLPPKGGEYDDRVQGDGAPRWVLEACLPEKNFDSKWWGTPRVIGDLDEAKLRNIASVYQRLTRAPADKTDAWVQEFLSRLPTEKIPVNETTDMLPLTNWAAAFTTSLDLARAFACFYAGDKVFPGVTVGGKNLKDYVQDGFAGAWGQVAAQVSDLPNVMGYDLLNEPGSFFITLTAMAGMVRTGSLEGARSALLDLLGQDVGADTYDALVAMRVLPPDLQPATLQLWGLDKIDFATVAGMNNGFDERFLRPLYERAGKEILAKDPKAVIFIEGTVSAMSVLGGGGGIGGQWDISMTRPRGIPQIVWAPHVYADIYPFPGFAQPPRDFSEEEIRYRDYVPDVLKKRHEASHSLGNVPVVFGEFGTYWNYNGIENSERDGYRVSSFILNNYYEAFEKLFQSNIIWCYSYLNSPERGDGWNHEDFSLWDWDHEVRGELSWHRPFARAIAGKPISTHFHSDFHYFDPTKGVPDPRREFEVRYGSKETASPSEITVPEVQYPDGFYVWLSDGRCSYDPATETLFHHPTVDDPGFEHWVRILPPDPQREATGWRYFFKGTQVLEKN